MKHFHTVIIVIIFRWNEPKFFYCFQRGALVMGWCMMGLTRCWCWWGEVWKYFWLIFSQSAVVTSVCDLTKCRDWMYWWNIQYIDCNISGRYLLPQHFILKTGKNRTWYSCRQTNIYDLLSDFVIGNLFQYCPRITNLFTILYPASLHSKKLTWPFWKSTLKYNKYDI